MIRAIKLVQTNEIKAITKIKRIMVQTTAGGRAIAILAVKTR